MSEVLPPSIQVPLCPHYSHFYLLHTAAVHHLMMLDPVRQTERQSGAARSLASLQTRSLSALWNWIPLLWAACSHQVFVMCLFRPRVQRKTVGFVSAPSQTLFSGSAKVKWWPNAVAVLVQHDKSCSPFLLIRLSGLLIACLVKITGIILRQTSLEILWHIQKWLSQVCRQCFIFSFYMSYVSELCFQAMFGH